jgi:hypothetical protein
MCLRVIGLVVAGRRGVLSIATASFYFHVFFARLSFKQYDPYVSAALARVVAATDRCAALRCFGRRWLLPACFWPTKSRKSASV